MELTTSKTEAQDLREKMASIIKSAVESHEGSPRFATMRGSIRTGGPPDRPALPPDAVTKPQVMEKMGGAVTK